MKIKNLMNLRNIKLKKGRNLSIRLLDKIKHKQVIRI
jgi:hypothetical protein